MHTATELDQGPVEWYHSSTTIAVAGHRTWSPHPFAKINQLQPGDLIRFADKNYYVKSHAIVRFDQTWVLHYHGLVLSACSRLDGLPTSAEYRYVVFAQAR
jgi:sortase (surface protein transpeptidase)